MRAIEGALNRIVTFTSLNPDMPLTIDIAKHLLRDSIEEEQTIKDLTVDEIMKTVATHYGIKIEDILKKERTQTLVTPRQVAMILSRKLTRHTQPCITAPRPSRNALTWSLTCGKPWRKSHRNSEGSFRTSALDNLLKMR